jgi:hypothetical protein
MQMIYIYALRDPITNLIRYIGKTKDFKKRLQSHISGARNLEKSHRCARWIREIVAQGAKPTMVVLHSMPDDGDWQAAEKKHIAEYLALGHQLTNTTIGGNGFRDISIESGNARRANISASLSRAWENTEYRASHRAGRVAFLSSPEVKAQISARMKKTQNRPDVKLKNSEAQKAVWAQKKASMSAEEYEKYCAAYKSELWNDPEFKARRTAELQSPDVKARRYATRDTPEGIARRSEKLKAAWADPEARARRLAVMRSPEYKAKISEASKAAFQRPEAKENLARAMAEVRARRKAERALMGLNSITL